MAVENKVTMSVDSWKSYIDDDDIEFAYGVVDFLSNRPNTHKHIYSESVIKEYAPTVLGKWLVAEYSVAKGDVTTHTNAQKIVGLIPSNQDVKYRYDEDGYLVASVDIVMSKLYATEVYELFKRNNYRNVSIEELVRFSDETKDFVDGIQDKIIEEFNITGITILGRDINPSIPKSNIQLTKMSEDTINDMENAYVRYAEKLNSDNGLDKIDKVLSKLESIEQKLNKEEIMAKVTGKEVLDESVVNSEEIVENAESTEVENTEETVKNAETEQVDNACGDDSKEAETETNADDSEKVDNADESVENADEEAEKPEDETVENADESVEDKEDEKMAEKMAELEAKLAESEQKLSACMSELSELKEYRQEIQKSEMAEIAKSTMAKAKDCLSAEAYAEYEKAFEECTYESIGALKNEVFAKCFEASAKSAIDDSMSDIVDMGIPQETAKINSIWD